MTTIILIAALCHIDYCPEFTHEVEALEINHYGCDGTQIIVWETSDGERHCQYWESCACDAAAHVQNMESRYWYRLSNGHWIKAVECNEVWSVIDREIADSEFLPINERKGLR